MPNFFRINKINFSLCFFLLFTDYILIVAIVFAIFGLAHGAPKMRRLRRHKHWSDDPEYPHYPTKLMWNQSCGNDLSFTWKLGTSIRVVS